MHWATQNCYVTNRKVSHVLIYKYCNCQEQLVVPRQIWLAVKTHLQSVTSEQILSYVTQPLNVIQCWLHHIQNPAPLCSILAILMQTDLSPLDGWWGKKIFLLKQEIINVFPAPSWLKIKKFKTKKYYQKYCSYIAHFFTLMVVFL